MVLVSPLIRSILKDLPCCTKPTIIVTDFASELMEDIVKVLLNAGQDNTNMNSELLSDFVLFSQLMDLEDNLFQYGLYKEEETKRDILGMSFFYGLKLWPLRKYLRKSLEEKETTLTLQRPINFMK